MRPKLSGLFIEMLLVLRDKARVHDACLSEEDEEGDDGKVETGATGRCQATPAARDSDEESAI